MPSYQSESDYHCIGFGSTLELHPLHTTFFFFFAMLISQLPETDKQRVTGRVTLKNVLYDKRLVFNVLLLTSMHVTMSSATWRTTGMDPSSFSLRH